VVMMSAVNILSGEGGGIAGRCGDRVQQCWQFEHPRRDLILDAAGESFLPTTMLLGILHPRKPALARYRLDIR
jgi:protein arginine N-methyltransferase 5